ncbi:MAG TPA: hypothetical protein VF557_14310 [Jatrophihabitans sp.]|jgi:hypothetical protein|uniref:hypothetical protein n=1 Tax=Jatrophihabitans sp. TaxID=1932789 RepID=UPI002F0C0352
MNRQTEDRLRAAFDAKADQVTDERLDQLAEQRRQSLIADLDEPDGAEDFPAIPGFTDPDSRNPFAPRHPVARLDVDHHAASPRHARWFAPVLAAAAVIAVAVGVTAVSTSVNNGKRTPNPPATQVSTPTPTPTPTPSPTQTLIDPPPMPQPSGNGNGNGSTAVTQPSLLRGQEGARSQVPWSEVGPGWRLLKPAGDLSTRLYLYNPAGGRYLISDQLPPQAQLLAWSPDGERAMLSTAGRYDQLRLRSGQLDTGPRLPETSFLTYTQPRGLAMLLRQADSTGKHTLARYAPDGTLQLTYPATIEGVTGEVGYSGLYTADGSALVVGISPVHITATAAPSSPAVPRKAQDGLALLSNDGHLIRRFAAPAGYVNCKPLRWWSATSVLESCTRKSGSLTSGLFLQETSGGLPVPLAQPAGGPGYWSAWKLGNGNVLLANDSRCDSDSYNILHPDTGDITALKLPAGVSRPGFIQNMDGNVATFDLYGGRCSTSQPGAPHTLLDYNMVTGQSAVLFEGEATIVGYPRQD